VEATKEGCGMLEILLLVAAIIVGVLLAVGGVLLYRSADKPPLPHPTQFGFPLLFHPMLSMSQGISQGGRKFLGGLLTVVGVVAAFLALGRLILIVGNRIIA
jgi:hypothetical protein